MLVWRTWAAGAEIASETRGKRTPKRSLVSDGPITCSRVGHRQLEVLRRKPYCLCSCMEATQFGEPPRRTHTVDNREFRAVNLRSRRLLCMLLIWVVLAQPSLASVLSAEHAFSTHVGISAQLDAGRSPQLAAYVQQSDGVSLASSSASCWATPQQHGAHHHGCDHACHACAHFQGLPTCAVPLGFSGICDGVSWYRATWRSQHRSPPERPPRAIA